MRCRDQVRIVAKISGEVRRGESSPMIFCCRSGSRGFWQRFRSGGCVRRMFQKDAISRQQAFDPGTVTSSPAAAARDE